MIKYLIFFGALLVSPITSAEDNFLNLLETVAGETILKADDRSDDDNFGNSVSLDGNRAAIGSPGDEIGKGAVYVFEYDGNNWLQTAKIVANDGIDGDLFGTSISLLGTRILIGASRSDTQKGSAYIFELKGAEWLESAKLTANDAESNDNFGGAVSLSNDRALISAHRTDDLGNSSGSAYIYDLGEKGWQQSIKLTAEDGAEDNLFGFDVSLLNDRALIGSVGDDESSGSAYIFELSAGIWSQMDKLTADDAEAFDSFGTSVSLFGDYALIGTPGDDEIAISSGAAYLFNLEQGVWLQSKKLFDPNAINNDAYGQSVSLSSKWAVVGSRGSGVDDAATQSTYIYDLSIETAPRIAKFDVSDDGDDKLYGTSVSQSGDRLLVGSIAFDDFIGAAFINEVDLIFIGGFE